MIAIEDQIIVERKIVEQHLQDQATRQSQEVIVLLQDHINLQQDQEAMLHRVDQAILLQGQKATVLLRDQVVVQDHLGVIALRVSQVVVAQQVQVQVEVQVEVQAEAPAEVHQEEDRNWKIHNT